MKTLSTLALVTFTAIFIACQPQNTDSASKPDPITSPEAKEPTKSTLDVDAYVAHCDEQRNWIEENKGQPVVIPTGNLREKIKQKWEKIHFYVIGNRVARIKTYPYDQISHRTEEFYLEEGKLIVAIIEDHGTGDGSKEAEVIDKMYYFHNDEIVSEKGNEAEKEYSIRNSDAEELLSEVREYLEIYRTVSGG